MQNERLISEEIQDNFYIEDLEERLEMSSANPGDVPQSPCAAWVIHF